MANGTILDRAVQAWESEEWAYLYPHLGSSLQYQLTQRIAEEYPGHFDESLFQLLSAENPIVVAHVLEIIKLSKSKLAARLPSELFDDERTVNVACCFFHSTTIGQLARECRDNYSGSQSRQ